jgi:hypothetical protein
MVSPRYAFLPFAVPVIIIVIANYRANDRSASVIISLVTLIFDKTSMRFVNHYRTIGAVIEGRTLCDFESVLLYG